MKTDASAALPPARTVERRRAHAVRRARFVLLSISAATALVLSTLTLSSLRLFDARARAHLHAAPQLHALVALLANATRPLPPSSPSPPLPVVFPDAAAELLDALAQLAARTHAGVSVCWALGMFVGLACACGAVGGAAARSVRCGLAGAVVLLWGGILEVGVRMYVGR
ncbi:hypothetical protein BV25DRAFT_1820049 [Artomyces pyxidatus]|uniref:Uncharacterized protein n=1 Tax=Artomyces pyxidatus TaxID=48021 RepID=A0ACB8TEY1_9AGAM|nr:hypothetical protein BV25DRAFT_1820049 [Artomyces pyxidatus]